MAVRKLTAVMDYQDGEPFNGFLSVRLNAASKTDEKMVGPRIKHEVQFSNGQAQVDLYPNSLLEEGSYYKAEIFLVKTSGNIKSTAKLIDTAFIMPDEDCFLHDLAVIEPMRPSALEAVQAVASEAVRAASEISAEAGRLDALETASSDYATRIEAIEGVLSEPVSNEQIDALFA